MKNLYLGDMNYARDDNFLKENKITHILNCATELFPHTETYNAIKLKGYYKINLIDTPNAPFAEDYIRDGANKLNMWLEKGNVVYVHCVAGISRSPSVIIAYLMIYKQISYSAALNHVKKQRNIVNPNDGFVKILQSKIRIGK
jgi:protein-tyrosine phosphatase